MGLFDWLFGKKKDPYSSKPGSDYGDNEYGDNEYGNKPNNDQPRQPKPTQKPYRARPKNRRAQPPKPDERTEQLGYRQARSNRPLDTLKDQTIVTPRRGPDVAHLGGTPEVPDPHTDTFKLRSSGMPEIAHLNDLAEIVGTTRNEVIFLASRPGLGEPGHYTLKELPKKSGGSRMLMVPMPRMKAVQRALNAKLVSRLPVHEAAHGFRKGRDVLTGASPHVGKALVVSVDIEEFFPSFTFRRVSGYFRNLGYGRGVSVALANLMTARPCDGAVKQGNKWKPVAYGSHPDIRKRRYPEIPQGAPTSPGIANAICWRMDKRLHALAQKFGADYTRYADDLTFSGNDELAKSAGKLLQLVRKIVKTEGLALNENKTRIMRTGRQQRVTGVVVNQQTNVSRRDFDKLKAILHNCIKHGPGGQNREGVPDFKEHLRGRIAHFSHIGPERGRKLKTMFEQIRW